MLAFHSWQSSILRWASMALDYSNVLQLMKCISLREEHKLLLSVFHSLL